MSDIICSTSQELLEDSQSFCILPFIHVHRSPNGDHGPCCIGLTGDLKPDAKLLELVNSDVMKQVRSDMLNNIKNPVCFKCHRHEEISGHSARQDYNKIHGKFLPDVLDKVESDGTLNDFKMRYYDIRFNNLCNFKCRTCGPGYSSQWSTEILKYDIYNQRSFIGIELDNIIATSNTNHLLDDIIEQIPNLDTLYFAGGEPLIDENHYAILTELIRQGRTDVWLKYNTNVSNLNFKNYDIIDLWSNFAKPVYLSASIDHTFERAEYIRTGTNWDDIIDNLFILKNSSYVDIDLNTVVSNLNFVTIADMINDLWDYGLLTPSRSDSRKYDHEFITTNFYPCMDPPYLSLQALPSDLKKQGIKKIENMFTAMSKRAYIDPRMIESAKQCIEIASQTDTWQENNEKFREYIKYFDDIRNDDFLTTFPELATMMKKPDGWFL